MSVPLRPLRSDLRFAQLGDFYVDLTANRLRSQDREVRLTPKSMAVLRELMLRQNLVVRRDDLLGLVWPDAFPTDDVLTQAIKELRRALGDDSRAPVIIETIPRVGYRLRASVRVLGPPEDYLPSASGQPAANETESPFTGVAEPVLEALPAAYPRDDDADAATVIPATQGDSGAAAASRHGRSTRIATAGLVALLASIGTLWIAGGVSPRAEIPARDVARVTTPMEVALTADPGSEYFATISPDGSVIAYIAAAEGEVDSGLTLKGRDPAARAVSLVPVRTGHWLAHPAWSPDGTRILYVDVAPGECTVRIVPVSGGAAQTLAPCESSALDGFDWAPDQRTVYGSMPIDDRPGARILMSMSIETGQQQALVYQPRSAQDTDGYPRISPDGRWIAFRRGAGSASALWLMPREGGLARPLPFPRSNVNGMAWTGDSASLIVSSDHAGSQALYRVSITGGAAVSLGIDNAHFPSVAHRNGHLVYYRDLELSQMVVFDLEADGRARPGRLVVPASRSDSNVALSPSGQRVAFVSERSGRRQLWLHDFEANSLIRLTDEHDAIPHWPQWSPDELSLLYVRREVGVSRLMRVEIASGRTAAITAVDEQVRMGSYSSDGEWIDYASDRGGSWQIWRMRADATGARPLSHAGGVDPRSFAGDPHVYFTQPTGAGLHRVDPATGAVMLVSRQISPRSSTSYWVGEDALWVFRGSAESAQARIMMRSLSTGLAGDAAWRELSRVAYPGGYPAPALASVSRDRRRLIATMVTRDGTDVFVTQLTNNEG